MEVKSKKPWLSKTVWVNAIMAGVAFIPGVAEKLSVESAIMLMSVIGMGLRMVTKDKVSLLE